MKVAALFGEDAYAMQLFGVVFGFLSVTRLNMAGSWKPFGWCCERGEPVCARELLASIVHRFVLAVHVHIRAPPPARKHI